MALKLLMKEKKIEIKKQMIKKIGLRHKQRDKVTNEERKTD